MENNLNTMVSMLKKSATFLFFLLINVYPIFSQKTYWASKVLEFSSERVIPFQTTEYKAIQALGKPNVLPNFVESTAAWEPSQPDSPSNEFISVGFDTLIRIHQVAVAENYGQGCIDKILALDVEKKYHTLYQCPENQLLHNKEKGKFLNVFLPKLTPYQVVAIKLVLNTEKIKGPNQIDAIGISETLEPIKSVIRVAADAPKEVVRENLGKGVNSRHQEFAPVISSDGKTLFYTRNHLSMFGKEKDQDIWFSVQDNNGNWIKSKNIGYPINTNDKNAVFSVSADGTEILLMNKYNKDGKLSPGISRSYRTRAGWAYPEEVKIDNYYNQSPNAEYAISADGMVMVMSIQRKNSTGKRDLYVSFKKDKNEWSEPVNMGRQINTYEHDVTPFIAADGKTLYFSTQGLPGFGNNDIFKTQRLDDTWQLWSEPENLGSAINTPNWDGYFTLPASGEYAYVCSMNASKKEDIYRLELPKTAKPEPVAIISGNVLTTTDKKPIEAVLTMTPQNDKLKPEVKNYDPATGAFSFVVPLKEIYDFVPYSKGYLAISETVDLSKEISYREIKKDFYLMPLEVGNKGVLNSFTFEQGESKLQAPALKNLDRIAQAMMDFPTLEILFEGHTDNQGDFQLNLKLSEERIEEVKTYLISKGVPAERITTKGWGQTHPIASNATEERRKLNRRVEFTITKK
jgi:outer membrane protein OmpA-like peptidoglycan-associated protein